METPAIAPNLTPRKRRRWLRALVGSALALVLIAIGCVYWLVKTEAGAQFAFGRIRELIGSATTIEGVGGALGGRLTIARFEIVRPGLVVRILGLETDISPFYAGHLTIHRLHAQSVEVRTAPSGSAAPLAPSLPEFNGPFPLVLEDGSVGTFTYGAIASRNQDLVLEEIVLRGEGNAARWKVAEGSAKTPYGKVKLSGSVEGAAPFGLDASATFEGPLQRDTIHATATAKGTLESLEVQAEAAVAGARAAASARVQPFAATPLGTIAIDADAVDLSRFVASMPSTRLKAHAKLDPREGVLTGPLHIANAEPGTWDSHHLPLVSASGDIAISPHGVNLTRLDLVLPAGSARGSIQVSGDRGVQAELDLAEVDLATLHGALRKTQLAGKLAITGDRNAQSFVASVTDPRFALDAHATLASGRLEVPSARVQAAGGTLGASGALTLEGRREFHVQGEARNFDPSAFAATPKGDVNFTFSASGALDEALPSEAKVNIKPGTYAGLAASGHVHVVSDGKRISSTDVDVSLGEARLTAKGSLGGVGDAMDVTLHAPDLARIAKAFDAKGAGSLDARVRFAGTFEACSAKGAITGTNLLLPGDFRVNAMKLDLDGTRAVHHLDVQATVSPKSTAHIAVQGGFVPRGESSAWEGTLESLSLTGSGAFSLASPATLALATDSAELGEARMRGDWGEAHLEVTRWAHGAFDFKGSAPSIKVHNLARSLQLESPPLSDLVFSAGWNLHAGDTVDGSAIVKRESGDIRVGDPELAMGVSDAMLGVDIAKGRVAATLKIAGERIGAINGEAHGELARTGNGWQFAASAPVDAHVTAAIPSLEVLAAWLGPDTKLGGRLDAELSVTGTGADPRMQARANVRDLALHEPRSGFELAQGNAALHLEGTTLVIDALSAKTPWHVPDRAREFMKSVTVPAGGGSIGASGSVDFAAHSGSIRVKLDKVPVTQLSTRFIAVSGEASLESDAKGTLVTGSFKADGGWIGALAQAPPSPSDDIVVVRSTQPAQAKSREPIRIDIAASLGNGIAFQGRGLDTRLIGEMRVVGEIGAALRATGSIRTDQGTYEGYGQKLTIDRGVLTFAGPIDNPKLNVLATRKNLPVEPGVEVTGTTARPRVRLVSSPDVPESEKLSWLVLGRSAAGASPADISILTAAAGALLGGEGRPGAGLQKKLGIDEVSIGHSDSGSPLGVMPQSTVAGRTGAPAATDVVTIGSQLTSTLRMSYEQGFADAEGALKLSWSITRQFQLLARAGYLPGLDVVYRWTIK